MDPQHYEWDRHELALQFALRIVAREAMEPLEVVADAYAYADAAMQAHANPPSVRVTLDRLPELDESIFA
jgi:hypothetical protein